MTFLNYNFLYFLFLEAIFFNYNLFLAKFFTRLYLTYKNKVAMVAIVFFSYNIYLYCYSLKYMGYSYLCYKYNKTPNSSLKT